MPVSKHLSINAAADLLGKTRRTLVRAMANIEPDSMQRGEARFKLPTIIAALEHTGSPVSKKPKAPDAPELSTERAKLAKSQRRAVDLKHRILSNQVVDKDVMRTFIERDYSVVRDSALAMSGKLSDRLSGAVFTRGEAAALIRSDVTEWLNVLSKENRAGELVEAACSGDYIEDGDDDE
jgi:hypothetical protein